MSKRRSVGIVTLASVCGAAFADDATRNRHGAASARAYTGTGRHRPILNDFCHPRVPLTAMTGVAPQPAMHVHAPTCAGLHDRFHSLRGKVHLGAADGPGAGGKTGVPAQTIWRSSTGVDY